MDVAGLVGVALDQWRGCLCDHYYRVPGFAPADPESASPVANARGKPDPAGRAGRRRPGGDLLDNPRTIGGNLRLQRAAGRPEDDERTGDKTTGGGGIGGAGNSRGGKVRARLGYHSLAGGKRPGVAAVARSGGIDADPLSVELRQAGGDAKRLAPDPRVVGAKRRLIPNRSRISIAGDAARSRERPGAAGAVWPDQPALVERRQPGCRRAVAASRLRATRTVGQ